MSNGNEALYQQRLARYTAAMRNEKPDRVPVRPFAAEFAGKYAGFTNQQITHDFSKAFEAVLKCCADFDWDAAVGNMVYVWTGLTEAAGLKYYLTPGINAPANACFQYLEPPDEAGAHMKEDEYDALIADPTAFLANVWMPRVSRDVCAPGEPTTFRNNMSWLKGGLAMLAYFQGFGVQHERMRRECGTVPAIMGCLKAPFDIIADKLRGYGLLCMDLYRRPEKVEAACEALAPHMMHYALAGADPDKRIPISLWLHRGSVPFLSPAQFERFYWPTLKAILLELHRRGHQVLFYAEGDWNPNLKYIAELPDRCIVYHVDRGDPFEVHRAVGHKFCLSGGLPNELLALGEPDEVKAYCKKLIDGLARDGGYIMDAGAIMQDDPRVENIRAMTEFTREYGTY
ncbi:MAG: hypothetical protein GC154_07040 [bacterium]|nr:hypothetical protein [bacterium]